MREVYKARDTRLDRIVAIKISAAQFTDRFEPEVRAVAALNHSHICALYDVGPDYLVMEFVDGPTLTERIRVRYRTNRRIEEKGAICATRGCVKFIG
jgi:serine/threonine protein kinase